MEEIGDGAFQDNNIEKISFPDSVRRIGNSAFDENNLIEITMSKNIKKIGDWALGDYTDQVKQDYEQNGRKQTTYRWNEEKQEWQNQLKQLISTQGREQLDCLQPKQRKSIIL